MKYLVASLFAAAFAFPASAAFAADSGQRTTMPESCSDRNANCVIQDGPPRNRRGQLVDTAPQDSSKGGSAGRNTTDKPGETRSGSQR